MSMIRKVIIAAGALVCVLAAIIAIRTAMFNPEPTANIDGIKIDPVPKVDIATAAMRLGRIIQFKTISHQDPSENQTEEWSNQQRWLELTYPTVAKTMHRKIVGVGTLIYSWEGSDPALPAIILMAHQDVVPIEAGSEKAWKYPPFSGQIADDAIWGRGALDDKGSLIALFESLEALAKSGFSPRRTIYLVSGHDEEVGGSGAQAAAKLLESRGVKAQFTLDEGGAVSSEVPSINGPVIMIGVAEKGYATLRVAARTQGGHSSMPSHDLAAVNLAKAIVAINDHPFRSELRPPVSSFLALMALQSDVKTRMAIANRWLFEGAIVNKMASTAPGAAMLHTTIAPTMLSASPKENVLPQIASALINYRIAPWQTSSDIMKQTREAVGGIPVELNWNAPPHEPSPVSSWQSEGWKFIHASIASEFQGAPAYPVLVLGTTDSRYFKNISKDTYRIFPTLLKSSDSNLVHGNNEHIEINNFGRAIAIYERLIVTATK